MNLYKESLILSAAGVFCLQLQNVFALSLFVPYSLLGGGIAILAYSILNNEDKFDKLFKSMGFMNKENITPRLIKTVTTPYGHDYTFELPAGMNLQMFEKVKLSIEQYLDGKIKLEYKDNNIVMACSDVKLKEYYDFKYVKPEHYLDILIGYCSQGLKTLRIKQNMLICGTAGSGKSTLCRCIIVSLILNIINSGMRFSPIRLNFVDFKRTEYGIFKDCRYVNNFCVEIPEFDKLLIELEKESKRRYIMFEEKNILDINTWNMKYEKLPHIITFIDEIAQLGTPKESKSNEARFAALQRRLSYDRAAGLFYIISTQRPSVDIVTGSIKANIDIRISFKTVDSTNSWIVLDDEQAAQYLTCPGRGLLKEVSDLIEFQSPFLTENEAIKLVKRTFKQRRKTDVNTKG